MYVQMHKDLHRYVHSGVPKFKSTDFRACTHTLIYQTCSAHSSRLHKGSSIL